MNQTECFADPNTINARIALDLPGTTDPKRLPDELQWAPPGRHTIRASRAGKPMTLDVNVDEAGAQKVVVAHAKYTAAAKAGAGDRPFMDFNHEDREASAHPTEFYWGGSDPQQGGIRAKVVWTGAGERAVRGRDFRRFSPSFYTDEKGNITGMPVNCGGLVNRAAFERIAPIVSKSAEFEAVMGNQGFLAKAAIVARARNLKVAQAYAALAREEPLLYEEYRASLGLGDGKRSEVRPISASYKAALCDEFMNRARAFADALDIDLARACHKLAHIQPALYERFRAKLGLGDAREYSETVTAAHANAEESEFFVFSKRIAAERSIDMAQAFSVAARQRPDLYDKYHLSL